MVYSTDDGMFNSGFWLPKTDKVSSSILISSNPRAGLKEVLDHDDGRSG